MRTRMVVALALGLAPLAGLYACGLDQNGILSPDASLPDAPSPDVAIEAGEDAPIDVPIDVPLDVPPACTTLDASACFDGSLPGDWSFVAIVTANQACPGAPGDYTQQAYVTSPVPEAGACACGPSCGTTGSYSCAGTVSTGSSTNSSCTTATALFDAGDTPGCFPTATTGDSHLSVGPVSLPSGAITCDAGSVTVTQAWSATPVTACTPACTADFCGLKAPVYRCVASATSSACPGPFTQQRRIGPANAVNVTCSPCGCTIDTPPRCTATVEAFTGAGCDGGSLGTFGADGGCSNFGNNNNASSFLYTPGTVPNPTCSPTGSTGSATLSQFLTVCCIP